MWRMSFMTDNNKNKETIEKIKRQRIVKKVDGGNYARIGGTEFLASGEAKYVKDGNFQALKLQNSKEVSGKHFVGAGAKDLSGEMLKKTAKNIESSVEEKNETLFRPLEKQRA